MGLFDDLKKMTSDKIDSIGTTLQPTEGIKQMLIKQAVAINYDAVLTTVNTVDFINPKTKLIVDCVEVLKEASLEYNNSESPTREDEFIDYITSRINAERVIAELEPIVNMIPLGTPLLIVIKLILKIKTN